jgi:hypothetical protein
MSKFPKDLIIAGFGVYNKLDVDAWREALRKRIEQRKEHSDFITDLIMSAWCKELLEEYL